MARAVEFAAVVGNPPYQEADSGGEQGSARPLYHRFVEVADSLSSRFVSLITPSVWFTGGKGLDEFRQWMMSNTALTRITHFDTSQDVFSGVNLRGGVSYFLLDSRTNNSAEGVSVRHVRNGETISDEQRPARVAGLELFVVDNIGVNLVRRLLEQGHIGDSDDAARSFSSVVSARNPYGFATTFTRNEEFRETPEGLIDPVAIFASRGRVGYVERGSILRNVHGVESWKVLTPFANNVGTNLPDDNINSLISPPGTICTETYLMIGEHLGLTETECGYVVKYLKTRFARYLISLAKANQNGTRKTYRLVPLPDFGADSVVDWGASLDEIDAQLFDLYGLTDGERAHVRGSIQPMPDGGAS